MRNLLLLRDSEDALGVKGEVVAAACEMDTELIVLTKQGELSLRTVDGNDEMENEPTLFDLAELRDDDEAESQAENVVDHDWFLMTVIAETGCIVCLSHSGKIVSVGSDPMSGKHSLPPVLEGVIDSGILHAAWSPDQTRLVIFTGSYTLLSMSTQWDVLDEVPAPSAALDQPCMLSWRGDGEQFALLTHDDQNEDATEIDKSNSQVYAKGATVRIYTKELELQATGRNVAEGSQAVLHGVRGAVAYATNGSLVACALERVPGRLQVAFLERNGLRHGEFDIRVPPSVGDEKAAWRVDAMYWDLSTSMLAVGLKCDETEQGVVQLYHRGNYHWYLKQQFSGNKLSLLGFDSEVLGRLYMARVDEEEETAVLRTADIEWDTVVTSTAEASVAVTDGDRLLLTPLGRAVVPPPMSMYHAQLPGSCRHAAFFSASGNIHTNFTNGLLSLCDMGTKNADNVLSLHLLDEQGTPMQTNGRRTPTAIWTYPLANTLNEMNLKGCHIRAVQGIHSDTDTDTVFISLLVEGQWRGVANGQEEVMHTLITGTFSISTGKAETFISTEVKKQTTRLGVWPAGVAEDSNIALTVWDSFGSGTAVHPVSIATGDCNYELELNMPEDCHQTEVVVVEVRDAQGISNVPIVIGLTARNRLYCGETLLVAGASSFAVNKQLGVLMYITVGTTPALHFVPLDAVAKLDLMQGVDGDDQYRPELYDAAFPPRPVERGSRLVASISGHPNVVVQLPRGNLEAFEPRALLLAQTRCLLDTEDPSAYLECLTLLRRQRIDMNFLVDYKPQAFLDIGPSLVQVCLSRAPDALSLFISSLSDENVCYTKYPAPREVPVEVTDVVTPTVPPYEPSQKINIACLCLREPLLKALRAGNVDALQPVLCTFAKQTPPLLEEALQTIQDHLQQQAPDANLRALLIGPKGQAAIKYLAFLADSKALFDAAVSMCDFSMGRAVARQCQMDPKEYLPLLERLESRGRDKSPSSYEHADMRVAVNVHLERPNDALIWAARAIFRALSQAGEAETDVQSMCSIALDNIKEGKLYLKALPLLAGLLNTCKEYSSEPKIRQNICASISNLISDVRLAYGDWAIKSKPMSPEYGQAIAAYLAAEPPAVEKAINAARRAEDWQTALALAARFAKTLDAQAQSTNLLTPRRIASEIIEEFRASLEQADAMGDGSWASFEELGDDSESTRSGDKVTQAAQMCIEYLQDVEGAARLLLLSQRYDQAAQLALKHGRTDLLLDDVAGTVEEAARQLSKELQTKANRVVSLGEQLRTGPWSDIEARLKAAQDAEPLLRKEMEWLDAGGDEQQVATDLETQSDFSVATGRSDLSYVSMMSSVSGTSTTSGASTVSVLSDLQTGAEREDTKRKAGPGSQFSIGGLDHTLLSRGSGKEDTVGFSPKDADHARRQAKKMQKRALREENRGRSKDSLGFNVEARQATELLACAQISTFASIAAEICKVLTLVGGSSSEKLAVTLQQALDNYTATVRANPAPVAPLYPRAWLASKAMLSIRSFQDPVLREALDSRGVYSTVNANWQGEEADKARRTEANQNQATVITWWQAAARGVSMWHDKLRRTVLEVEPFVDE